jgi:exodeoxyribonuclease V alpha subunit
MVEIEGVIETVTCDKPESGWGVRRLKVDLKQYGDWPFVNRKGICTIVGPCAESKVGERVKVAGKVKNSSFGLQIQIDTIQRLEPRGTVEIAKFLEENVKNIGPKNARRIVEMFGEDTIKVIDNNPERLLEVKGIGADRYKSILKEWQAKQEYRKLLMFCTTAGISTVFLNKIYKKYEDAAIDTIKADPYKLARDIAGIGFKKADEIARHLGVVEMSDLRLRAACEHILEEKMQNEGHCFLPRIELINLTTEFLQTITPQVTHQMVTQVVQQAIDKQILVVEEDRVYLPDILACENRVARRLARMASMKTPPRDRDRIAEIIGAAKKAAGVELHPTQMEAVLRCLANRVSVLTGGPGTGKTTITKAVVNGWLKSGLGVTLLAPTGRAAKRMGQVIGLEASTMHRKLFQLGKDQREAANDVEYDADPGANTFGHSVVFLDESSMVDIKLMDWFLRFCTDETILVVIGDRDQLPSVGPGAVLRDLIASGVVGTTVLTHIFRQAQGSDICVAAHAINRGEMPKLNILSRQTGIPQGTDMFASLITDAEQQTQMAVWAATFMAQRLGFDPIRDVMVLSPQRKNACGVDMLNAKLQEALNPNPPKSVMRGPGIRWGVGDKVMHTANSLKLNLSNGDMGVITDIEFGINGKDLSGIHVDFDGRIVKFENGDEWSNLILAYASTIHKVQGSEAPLLIMVLHTSHFTLLQRNLVYTGLTRGKRHAHLIAHPNALEMAIRNNKVAQRNTRLAEKLREAHKALTQTGAITNVQ